MTITVGQQLLLLALVFGFLLLLFPLHILSQVSATADPSYPEAAECGVREDEDLMVMRREEYDEGRILDITHAYHEDMPAGGTGEGLGRFLWLAKSMRNGSLANSSEMKFSVHSGTHVDAPGHLFQHYFDAGFDVDVLNVESLHIPSGIRRVLFRSLDTDRRSSSWNPQSWIASSLGYAPYTAYLFGYEVLRDHRSGVFFIK